MVLTPKSWWHHCAHSEHQKSQQAPSDTLDDDCPVCDLTLSAFTRPVTPVFYFQKQSPIVHECAIFDEHSASFIRLFQLRAPPTTVV